MSTKEELCKRCQLCCKSLWFEQPMVPEAIEFYKARGLKTFFDLRRNLMAVSVPHVCQHLTPDGCKIYHNRPVACRIYDGRYAPDTKDKCLWHKL